ncbi:hypothetical protein ABZQ16_15930 [Pseudomonas paraeruginosa]|uniref:hypothetical protein n=1 Tax=Pseudomonas aeruginosa group TaxID=136841 RepID=UPI000F51146B|nr:MULTISPECIES: hypothetical protein [Pseudomonas aeruginosa group]KAB0752266.1 hypothetical protein F7O94_01915 [Pseudomonas aeruginosa]MBG4066665.1 hypothetical protein [Pseudomonas aeruginosa]MBG5603713.1 hypothetical protein [Pseudomonas aeruginosa]MBH3672696.1 hypothetical protein [Pseudomonas aeruginosa]MBH9431996.1 hypothetical protein [Pseudomonas aeruginosa]
MSKKSKERDLSRTGHEHLLSKSPIWKTVYIGASAAYQDNMTAPQSRIYFFKPINTAQVQK